VLLDGGLREEEPPRYLGVAQPLDHEARGSPSDGRRGGRYRAALLGSTGTRATPAARRARPSPPPRRRGRAAPGHPAVDKAGCAGPEGVPGERQVQLPAEDQDRRRARAQLPEALQARREDLSAVWAEYGRGPRILRGLRSVVHAGLPLQGPHEPGGSHRGGAIDPDQSQRFGFVPRGIPGLMGHRPSAVPPKRRGADGIARLSPTLREASLLSKRPSFGYSAPEY
jgi:hypothetical protein